ncbi:DNA cytosine methyltransferase [Azorhizobium caulinodans]|uniref:DNA cytosine methyltransferase n=1 Tax=Azorhizobium caulinodans TaxID=7 RepID=UPI002FBECE84
MTLQSSDPTMNGPEDPGAVRVLSLCTGMAGDAAAFAAAGIPHRFVAYAEVDPGACAVLAHHFPGVPNLGDLKAINNWSAFRGEVDVITAGIPCQPHSSAGRRSGLRDPRDLTQVFLEAVEGVAPSWVLVENVVGFKSSEGGRAYRLVTEGLGELGYQIGDRIIDARGWLPQRRKRFWLLGHRGVGGRAPSEILDLAAMGGGCPAAGRALRLPPSAGASGGAAVHYPPRLGTLTASGSGLIKPGMKGAELDFLIVQEFPEIGLIVRRPTPIEALRAQGFSDHWLDNVMFGERSLTDVERYKLAGNAWPVPVAASIFREMFAPSATH